MVRHIQKEITPEEAVELEQWLNQKKSNLQLFEDVNTIPEVTAEVPALDETNQCELDNAWARLVEMGWKRPKAVKMGRNWEEILAAVAFITGVVCTCIFWQGKSDVNALCLDVKSKVHYAYLTLDNGHTITLDDSQNGLLARQGTATVIRSKEGGLRYASIGKKTHQLIFNKVTVPCRSDVVYLKLSDDSKVWLNAESSMRYPVVFNEAERKVEITGEVYFEVRTPRQETKQDNRFIVNCGGIRITAQNASFNVNMNTVDGSVKVTLLEGSVKVDINGSVKKAKSGQQAVLYDKTIDLVRNVDVESEMAWKKGMLAFK